jgi:hypothetical protein
MNRSTRLQPPAPQPCYLRGVTDVTGKEGGVRSPATINRGAPSWRLPVNRFADQPDPTGSSNIHI